MGKPKKDPPIQQGNDGLLRAHLAMMVPLKIAELGAQGGPAPDQWAALPQIADQLGAHGDVLLFGQGTPGQVTNLMNQMVEGIAVLAFCPGGITLFGDHWEA